MSGLLDPVSDHWEALHEHRLRTLLVLGTEPPFGDQNRRHLTAFTNAVPQADVWWIPEAGHDIFADTGPSIGDDLAAWIRENG